MIIVNVTQAKTKFSELLEHLLEGHQVHITRHGKTIAILSGEEPPAPKKPIDLERLARFRETMPKLSRPSYEIIREMRDEGY